MYPLKYDPSVFVIGDCYDIVIITEKNSIVTLTVGEKIYYEENSGVLSTEKNKTRIKVPMAALDSACEYTVTVRETIDRKAYFSEMGEPVSKKYAFKPVSRDKEMNIYFLSDVHAKYESAEKAASYFGDSTDLYILGGDITEVESIETIERVLLFCSNIAHGEIPIVFVRGNHDTRGKLAELYTDYFPADGQHTFYTFRQGFINGIVLDLGEDKPDSCPEYTAPMPDVYGGINIFSDFRDREDEFISSLKPADEGMITLAITHIPPAFSNRKPNTVFDIEKERYRSWSQKLDEIGVSLMLSGHYHDTFVLGSDDERNTAPHSYPIVIGSSHADGFTGTAITLCTDGVKLSFTDENLNTHGTYSYKFKR